MEINQDEADGLIKMPKERTDDTKYLFPSSARTTMIPLVSKDGKEEFFLDLHQCHIRLKKLTLQNRARIVIVLLRLDLEGPPHMNPDGKLLTGPHLHIYRAGFGDRFAVQLPPEFTNPDDKFRTLQHFLKYCNVTHPPVIDRGMLP